MAPEMGTTSDNTLAGENPGDEHAVRDDGTAEKRSVADERVESTDVGIAGAKSDTSNDRVTEVAPDASMGIQADDVVDSIAAPMANDSAKPGDREIEAEGPNNRTSPAESLLEVTPEAPPSGTPASEDAPPVVASTKEQSSQRADTTASTASALQEKKGVLRKILHSKVAQKLGLAKSKRKARDQGSSAGGVGKTEVEKTQVRVDDISSPASEPVAVALPVSHPANAEDSVNMQPLSSESGPETKSDTDDKAAASPEVDTKVRSASIQSQDDDDGRNQPGKAASGLGERRPSQLSSLNFDAIGPTGTLDNVSLGLLFPARQPWVAGLQVLHRQGFGGRR